MKLQFVNTQEVLIQELSENKNYSGIWTISFTIQGLYSSSELDKLFTEDNITTLTIVGENNVKTITGYTKVTKMIIRYSEDMSDALIHVTLQSR